MRPSARSRVRVRVVVLRVGLSLLAPAALTASACTTPAPPPYPEALADAPRRAWPLGARIAVAPPELLPSAGAAPLAGDPARAVRVDPSRLAEALIEAVRASAAAEDAVLIDVDAGGSERSEGPPGDPRDEAGAASGIPGLLAEPAVPVGVLAERARASGAEHLLRARVRRSTVRFAGVNGHFVSFALLFINFWLPAYWVADERYRAELEVELELYRVAEVRGGAPRRLLRRTLTVEGEVVLDTFDRGWNFFGSFTVPEALDDDSYREVAAHAMPHAHVELARRVAEVLADAEVER